jgi:hypothetical protein
MMYNTLIIIHNILRWGVLFAGIYAITKAAQGVINKKDFEKADNLSQIIFVIFCHTQLLIGLILYFISPAVDQAFKSGEMMKNAGFRFVAVEHIATMVIAIAFIQVGRTLSKKAANSLSKHKIALKYFAIGMIMILARIPWSKAFFPGM